MTADSLFPTSGMCWAGGVFALDGRSSRRMPSASWTIRCGRTDVTGRRDESRGDALHRMTRIEQAGQSGGNAVPEKRIDLTYDAASQWQTITRYADLAATKLVATSDYTFDAAGRLTALTHAQGATPLAGYAWTYDAANRVTEFTSLLDGAAEYAYDDTDQLVDAEYDYQDDEAYDYDANGNRTMTGDSTGDNNLVLSDGTYDYQYDAEGNHTRRTHIASGEVTDYQWDHRNRLTRITIRPTANDPLTTDILYAYDAFNRLVRVTLHTTDNGPLTTDTFHVYDGERWERGNAGDHLALVFDGNGDLTNRYLYGPAVDQILADEQLDSLTTPADVLWPLTDNLGTVRDLAAYDDATGDTTVVNHRTYTAFGQILDETDPTIQHRFAYIGRDWDADAGLYHYRARWYDPALGRFLTEDPIGFEAGDANLQRYVANSPANAVDSSGLAEAKVIQPKVISLPLPRQDARDETTANPPGILVAIVDRGTFEVSAYRFWEENYVFRPDAPPSDTLGFSFRVSFSQEAGTGCDDIRLVIAKRSTTADRKRFLYPDEEYAPVTPSFWTIFANYRPLEQPSNRTRPSIYLADPDGGQAPFLFPNDNVASRGQHGKGSSRAIVQNGITIATKEGETNHNSVAAAYCESRKEWLGATFFNFLVVPATVHVYLRTVEPVLEEHQIGKNHILRVQGKNDVPDSFTDALNLFVKSPKLESRSIVPPRPK